MPKPKRVIYTDKTLMPWGIHKGLPMADVPGSYLLWLFQQPWIRDWPDLHTYLVANQTALLAEEEVERPKTDGFDSYEDYEKYGR
jgi:hypothetical protein